MRRALLAALLTIFSFGLLFAPAASAAIDNTPDNDTVAIIRGGVFSESAVRSKAKQGDVPKVYAAFGIKQGQLNGFVNGVVWKDGRVTIGQDKVVARNAITAGRWDNPTSDMTKIAGTNRAYKMSTRHFTDEGQTAFIKMVNGRFAFAIIKPCGNPVTATPVDQPKPEPTPKPNFKVEKKVAKIDTSTWSKSITVEPGSYVKYWVVVTNTGKVALDKLRLQDVFPNGISQGIGTVYLNDKLVNERVANMTLPPLQPGQKHTILYGAQTDSNEKRTSACTTGLKNKAVIKSGVLPDKSDTATVKVCAPKQPSVSYACKDLKYVITDKSARKAVFTPSYTKSGNAAFVRYTYNFGDGAIQNSTEPKIEHTFAEAREYEVTVNAVFMVDGKEQVATSDECAADVAFVKAPTPDEPEDEEEESDDTPAPTKLVDTGPGAIIGGFFSVVTSGFVAYKFIWLRRFGL